MDTGGYRSCVLIPLLQHQRQRNEMLLMIAQQDNHQAWHGGTNFRRENGLEPIQLSVLLCQVREEFTKYLWALVSSHLTSRLSLKRCSITKDINRRQLASSKITHF